MSDLSSSKWHPNYPNHRGQGADQVLGSPCPPEERRRSAGQRQPLFPNGMEARGFRASAPNDSGRYEEDPRLLQIVARAAMQMKDRGFTHERIENSLSQSMEIAEKGGYSGKNICLAVLAGIGVVLVVLLATGKLSLVGSLSSRLNIDGLTSNDIANLGRLLDREKVDLSRFTLEYSDGPTTPRNLEKLNVVLQSSYRFIVVATSQNNQQNRIFGVYIDKTGLAKSFIFSLNHMSILPVDRETMAWEVSPRVDNGPRFGKSDLQFFVFKSTGYDSMSNLCYNYRCPQGLEYGTTAANEYLAGSEIFRTQHFNILVDRNYEM